MQTKATWETVTIDSGQSGADKHTNSRRGFYLLVVFLIVLEVLSESFLQFYFPQGSKVIEMIAFFFCFDTHGCHENLPSHQLTTAAVVCYSTSREEGPNKNSKVIADNKLQIQGGT